MNHLNHLKQLKHEGEKGITQSPHNKQVVVVLVPGTEVRAPPMKAWIWIPLPFRSTFWIKMVKGPSDLLTFYPQATGHISTHTTSHASIHKGHTTPTHVPSSLVFKGPWHLAECILLPTAVQTPRKT